MSENLRTDSARHRQKGKREITFIATPAHGTKEEISTRCTQRNTIYLSPEWSIAFQFMWLSYAQSLATICSTTLFRKVPPHTSKRNALCDSSLNNK
jgi:hypothetical protein